MASPVVLWRWWFLIVIMVVIVAVASQEDPLLITRIAFGSCSNQSSPQPIWDAIVKFNPQLFIWMGDNIYGDIKRPFKLFGKDRTIGPWKNVPRFIPSSEQEMLSRYHLAKNNPGYSRLREVSKVIGTWDDHDYGLNDAGKEFGRKITNQRLLLDFLDEPQDSPRRKQAGVYTSYTFGPVGRQVKAILLDTRYHRDPLHADGSILGTSQWTWLEEELNGPASAITIIGSSIQVFDASTCARVLCPLIYFMMECPLSYIKSVSNTEPLFSMESWGRFPKERNRLFKLISDSKRNGVFFISGDVHFGEITRFDCAIGYPLYDITSSGLTQAVEKAVPQAFGFLVRFAAWFTPTTTRVKNKNCRYKSCTYGKPNFGAIEINWDAVPVNLKFEVRDANGGSVTSVSTSLLELQAKKVGSEGVMEAGEEGKQCSLEVSLPWIVRHRLAMLFYCALAALLLVQIGVIYVGVKVCVICLGKRKLD